MGGYGGGGRGCAVVGRVGVLEGGGEDGGGGDPAVEADDVGGSGV